MRPLTMPWSLRQEFNSLIDFNAVFNTEWIGAGIKSTNAQIYVRWWLACWVGDNTGSSITGRSDGSHQARSEIVFKSVLPGGKFWRHWRGKRKRMPASHPGRLPGSGRNSRWAMHYAMQMLMRYGYNQEATEWYIGKHSWKTNSVLLPLLGLGKLAG